MLGPSSVGLLVAQGWCPAAGWLSDSPGRWWAMPVGMLLFWGIVIGLAVWAVRRFTARPDRPLQVARDRYARGELSREEFDELLDGLGHGVVGR